ncbi:hypothetical protein HPB52_003925 [Rhipicephalus sanguineus]|uniref:VWFA domain-containing protein n=1 Tax=Rhipicephalus sanguineus TaxID=34632 RepID=A0A9D4QD43_RHISA|nr:hypothetical protein HPB52_003925 [Rhipicephalus sanguineus]
MDHLEDAAKTTEGAIIALLSDGEENRDPRIESVMPLLFKAKVVVNTLAVGAKADDKLEKLASETRGKAFAIKDLTGNTALEMEAAFVRATTPSRGRASRSQTAGTWVLHVSSSDKGEVSIQVKSKARKEGVEPIQVSCTMANMLVDRPDAAIVYAKVNRGEKVVLGASVLAAVYGPKQQRESTLLLHDDGREPDNHAGDGTYSGYFTDFTGKGRYKVTARVSHQNGTLLAYPTDSPACAFGEAANASNDESTGSILGLASEHPMDDFILTNTTAAAATYSLSGAEPVDPFDRVASGGSFQVTKPISRTHVPPGNIRDLATAHMRLAENGSLFSATEHYCGYDYREYYGGYEHNAYNVNYGDGNHNH